MNSFWNRVCAALATGLVPFATTLTLTDTRPVQQFAASLDGASAFHWLRFPYRRSYRAAQREARARRNRRLHHGRRS